MQKSSKIGVKNKKLSQLTEFLTENEIAQTSDEGEPSKPEFLSGVCGKCLDTGYVHDVVDGVLGVMYTAFTQEADGIPIKKLMICNHGVKTQF